MAAAACLSVADSPPSCLMQDTALCFKMLRKALLDGCVEKCGRSHEAPAHIAQDYIKKILSDRVA